MQNRGKLANLALSFFSLSLFAFKEKKGEKKKKRNNLTRKAHCTQHMQGAKT
jgi:hypothetical protein